MPADIILREFEAAAVSLDAADMGYLLDHAAFALELIPTTDHAVVTLRARQYVGALRLPSGLTLELRPKFDLTTLGFLLMSAAGLTHWLPETFNATTTTGIGTWLVDQVVAEADHLVSDGLLTGFTAVRDSDYVVRGKIDVTASLRDPLRPVTDRADIGIDTPENRLLKAGLLACLRLVEPPHRTRIQGLLDKVASIPFEPDPTGALTRLSFDARNQRYERALTLAALLADNQTIQSGAETQPLPTFLIDMQRLFEQFVTHQLKARLPAGFSALAQPRYALDQSGRLTIRPDLVIVQGGHPVCVADVKYKSMVNTADIYQALVYSGRLRVAHAALITPSDSSISYEFPHLERDRYVRLQVFGLTLEGSRYKILEGISSLVAWATTLEPSV